MSSPLIIATNVDLDLIELSNDGITLPEITETPTTPNSGFWKVYPKNDTIYIMDSNGVEYPIDSGGTYVPPPPPSGSINRVQYFCGILGSTGINSGSLNQAVDGSVTPQTFYIEANPNFDIHIKRIVSKIVDDPTSLNNFGGIPPLQNGWNLKLTENDNVTFIAHEIKTFGEMLLSSSGLEFLFGDSAELANITGKNDSQICVFPVGKHIPGGIRIGRGNSDRIESIIQDDLTGLIDFTVSVYGYKNIPVT